MDTIAFKMLLFFAASTLAAWPLLFAGLSTRRDVRRRKETEYTRTTGVIVDYVQKSIRRARGGGTTYWKPVVEFTAEGQAFHLTNENMMDRVKFPVGTEVDILYDVSDPSRFHLAEDPVFTDPGGGAIRIAVVWILACAALSVALAVFVGGARFDFGRIWRAINRTRR